MRLWTACARRGRALLPPSGGGGRRLLSSTLTFPNRLDPQLEKAISAFKKPKATLEAKTKALVDEFGMLQRIRVQKVTPRGTDRRPTPQIPASSRAPTRRHAHPPTHHALGGRGRCCSCAPTTTATRLRRTGC